MKTTFLEDFNAFMDSSEENRDLVAEALNQYLDENNLEVVSEGTTRIVKFDQKSQRKRMMNKAALAIAKENNDPLYLKYQKANRNRLRFRDLIRKKYQSQTLGRVTQWEHEKTKRTANH